MKKYICIHGHFYQPPREDAWSGVIEKQVSAAPFHDWNERITAECYMPNCESPIHGKDGTPSKYMNNFEWISYNIGPTLMSWLEEYAPDTYEKIIQADHQSKNHFNGCGNAMAQAYNHMIMPLANERDKRTQVIWGIKDFEHRYGRSPKGMWLPETAVNTDTLEVLAEFDIQFTVLAPKQAKKVRGLNDKVWKNVNEQTLDTNVPYLCKLPSGKTICLFFYNGVISSEIAFGDVIQNGEEMAKMLDDSFKKDSKHVQLAHIATDGETYGHHREFGNMALSYLIEYIQKNKLAKVTNYAQYLKEQEVVHEVAINENTAWSSSIGVERWKSAEGGCIHHKKGWTQQWRKPLREAMDWLRDQLIPLYENEMSKECPEPWSRRDSYINDILAKTNNNPLLEMQHMSMLMYTSCGWFFDDISGIETVQILQYAARAMEIAKDHLNVDLEAEFLEILDKAHSNIKRKGTGKDIYLKEVKVKVHHA